MANRANALHNDMVRILANYARQQTNEAPWYGSLNVLLSQQLNTIDIINSTLMVVVPQLPLTMETIGNGGDEAPSVIASPDDPLRLTSSPPDPHRQGVKNKPKFSEQEFEKFNSSRIPDFVRMRVYNYNTDNVRHRIDLLVEVKKAPRDPNERGRLMRTVQTQVYQQAYHAFQPDVHLHTLGCLIVMGDEWEYMDIERAPTMVRMKVPRRDPTYEPSETTNDGSSDSGATESERPQTPDQTFFIPPPPLAPLNMQSIPIGSVSFLDPQALAQQQTMLRLIHEHLEGINQTMVHSYT